VQTGETLENTKPFYIDKALVYEAYKQVKANKGAAGIDEQSLVEFEIKLADNLYKLWNRMSSGSYFPPPVKAVEIPKRSGGKRTLGIPTVADRIAQTVVKMLIEPEMEKHFHEDSYGYRPGRSALDGIARTRERCWKYPWIIEYDIKGMFDNIDHERLMKAARKHVKESWQLLYIERWLKAPIIRKDGTLTERVKGTPQGGVISPILSNLFMHYAVDMWLEIYHSTIVWARYADDGVIHCKTKSEAEFIVKELGTRLQTCGLEMHPEKTNIVYCGQEQLNEKRSFTFLGYTFHPRRALNRFGEMFTSFLPAVSNQKLKEIRATIRMDNIRARVDLSIEDIARWYNPKIRGWYNYFGKFYPSRLTKLWKYLNRVLMLWAKSKYKNMRTSNKKAVSLIQQIQNNNTGLFFHWKLNQGKTIYV
jgi:RNA-directed DNA polymerase